MVLSLILLLVAALPLTATGQQPRAATAASIMGTYQVRRGPGAGCWLEVAPVAADSVRVQLQCSRGAPSHHLGFLDERLPFHAGTVVHEASGYGGHCRISIRFTGRGAVVRQDGSDLACGFGFGVYADGTYRRTSRGLPTFDLNPAG